MRNKPYALASIFLLVLALGVLLGWQMGAKRESVVPTAAAATATESAGRKVLYWYDPMKPDAHFDQPGKSPFMDMDLVPRYADEDTGAGAAAGLGLPPAFAQNLGVKLARVEKGVLEHRIEISASVAFDGHAIAVVDARTGGIVERAYPLAVGDRVRAGEPLVDIRVPEWFTAQSEYLALRSVPQLAAAARARLLQLGMSAAEVAALERSGQARPIATVRAPRGGMLTEFDLRQGMTIAPGQTLARINGIDSVWLEGKTPETEAARLMPGGKVKAWFTALPGQTLEGKLDALIPELDRETRTVRVRVRLPNPQGSLKPGMLARIRLEESDEQRERLLVPTDAIIATGKRHLVIAADGNGRFIPVEITPEREANGKTEIAAGTLSDGERIVVSGQFMIDSEASLRGVLARMESTAAAPATADKKAKLYAGDGIVKSVGNDEIVLAHEPIAELKWPAMTMPFTLASAALADGVIPGQKVRFLFSETNEGPVIQKIDIAEAVSIHH